MKKFWIIDGYCEDFETKELAIEAAKKRAAMYAKRPYSITNYPFFDTVDDDVCYVYEAVAIARAPTPDIQVEEITT
jgi:hypothetical protein